MNVESIVMKALICVLFLLCVALIIVMVRKRRKAKAPEGFQNLPDSYEARLSVISVFDTLLKRNPTPKEITKYSKLKNEQDILNKVSGDYSKEKAKVEAREKFSEEKPSKKKKKQEEEEEEDAESDDASSTSSDSNSDDDQEELQVSTDTHKNVSKQDLEKMKTHLSETLKLVNSHV